MLRMDKLKKDSATILESLEIGFTKINGSKYEDVSLHLFRKP